MTRYAILDTRYAIRYSNEYLLSTNLIRDTKLLYAKRCTLYARIGFIYDRKRKKYFIYRRR